MTNSIQQTNPQPPHLGWWHLLNPTVPGKPPDQQCWTKPTCGTCGLWCCLFSWTLEEDFGKFEVHAILGWQTSIHPSIQPTNFNDSLGGNLPRSFFTSLKKEGGLEERKTVSIYIDVTCLLCLEKWNMFFSFKQQFYILVLELSKQHLGCRDVIDLEN